MKSREELVKWSMKNRLSTSMGNPRRLVNTGFVFEKQDGTITTKKIEKENEQQTKN